jgi:hypothetical protein
VTTSGKRASMKTRVASWIGLIGCCAVLAAGLACNDDAGTSPKGDGAVTSPKGDGAVSTRPEAGPADLEADGCDPGCHWDCLAPPGPYCQDGKVYLRYRSPVWCCKWGDPWSGPLPQCTTGHAHVTCPSGDTCRKAESIDTRYGCMATFEADDAAQWATVEQLRLWCSSVGPRSVGDTCTTDADCRPAAPSVAGALTCDSSTKTCVEQPRPTPTDYLASCGLTQKKEGLTGLVGGGLCMGRWDDTAGCLKQARTYRCSFDEDCPAGSSCKCGFPVGRWPQPPTASYCWPDQDYTLTCPMN